MKIIAAVPCFNTGKTIGNVVSKAQKYVDQVIIIDDGSQDNTGETAKANGATVISHGTNRGYGETIMSCFEAARKYKADILVTIDGDGQHNPDEIPALIEPILHGEADMTIGSRFLNDSVKVPAYRSFGIRLITFLFNLGSLTRVSDSQSGLRAYHQRLFTDLKLTEKGMSSSIETLQKMRQKRAIIKEVPASCKYIEATRRLSPGAITHGLLVALAVIKIRIKSRL